MILTQYATTTTNPANLTGSLLTVFSQSNAGSTQEVMGTIRISARSSTTLTTFTIQVNNPNRLGEQTVDVTGLSSFEIPLAPIVWRAGETLSVSVLSDNAGDNATTVVCDFHIRSLSATAPVGWINNAAIADNAIGASKIAADAIGASELAADAVTEIAAGVRTNLATELSRIDIPITQADDLVIANQQTIIRTLNNAAGTQY